ncbi:MAG: Gfo/Idh/MocA family oxidoreductase [Spirochaetales bacterium]|nr:Gfo/Idh/MocA family oxidoreductase [Leptospiraceae bacterium]MCP5482278.1 Gfo/Idh/MocA family oxidoreductase [Spirochaetales bacterium]
MSTPIRTALLGLGRIAWSLENDPLRFKPCTHAGSLRALNEKAHRQPPFQLVAACDPKPGRLADFKRWWGRPGRELQLTTAWQQALTEGPELVIIAASTGAHVDLACEAIAAGARSLVVEKPLATNTKDAQRLLDVARKARVRVWINFERRYHAAYRTVFRYLERKTLGPLRMITGRVLTGEPPRGARVGPLLHDAVHWLDLLLWYSGGPPLARYGRVLRKSARSVEHTACLGFQFQDHQAFLEAGGRRAHFEFEMVLDCERGRIEIGNGGLRVFRTAASRRYKGFRELRPVRVRHAPPGPWLNLYREVRRETRRGRPSERDFVREEERITTRPLDSLHGIRIIEQAYRLS